MKELIIKNYIDKLTIQDIEKFATNNNLMLSNQEYEYLYKVIKDKWYQLIFGNPKSVFNELEKHLSQDTYKQVLLLYQTYKDKYSHYL